MRSPGERPRSAAARREAFRHTVVTRRAYGADGAAAGGQRGGGDADRIQPGPGRRRRVLAAGPGSGDAGDDLHHCRGGGLPRLLVPDRDLPGADLRSPVVLGARRHRRRDHRAHRACQGGPGSDSDDVISYMLRALFADGLGTALFSAIGGSPTTTYAENIGMMAATRVYSTAANYVAALVAILLGLVPKVRRGGQRHPGRRARRDHRRALRHDRPAGRQDLDRQQGQLSQSGQPGADRRRRDRDQLRQVGWPARSRRSGRNRTG